jgi:hypothetical protein
MTDLAWGERVFVRGHDQDGTPAPLPAKIVRLLRPGEVRHAGRLFPGAGYDCIILVLGHKLMARVSDLYKCDLDVL